VSPTSPEPAVIAEAAAVLARGGLVAFPTETVYGLGARGLHERDVGLIFVAKDRPTGHPLILHVDGEDMARTVAGTWPERASLLARTFWPGPLTLVVARASHVPDVVSGGLATVGVRAPRHPVALALIRAVGEPLAAPSANAHMHVSPTTAAHVVRSLGDRVDLVLDAGPCLHGIESTVLDLVNDPPRVLRAGATSLEAIRAIVPEVAYDAITLTGDAARASPGLASKHYAPRTRVVLAEPATKFLANLSAIARGASRVGAVVWSAEAKREVGVTFGAGPAPVALATLAALPDDPEGYAHGIFAALHDADAAELDLLVIERVPDSPAWWAVADRLRRAAEK
jgi:L-threonylcarbamoyladenylate synthase